MKREPTYVGIDVAKDRVDIAVRPTGQSWSASYEEEEVEKLVARLRGLEPAAVILEATGGLELTLVAALAAASLPVAVINPRQVCDFAKSTGQLAKNDRLDAQVLAHFGEAIHPPMRALRDADTQVLGAMLTPPCLVLHRDSPLGGENAWQRRILPSGAGAPAARDRGAGTDLQCDGNRYATRGTAASQPYG